MGDRWNIHNDEIEAARYRAEVPLRWRVLYAGLMIGLVVGVPVGIVAAWVWGGR